MDILTSLHKSLQPNWSTPILCRNINNAGPRASQLLEGIRSAFNTYDNKVKLRILLSFLGIKRESVSENAIIIKQILEQASDVKLYEGWVSVIAGIVHRRLFQQSLNNNDPIEKSLSINFDELAENLFKSIEKISSNNDESTNVSTLQPFEAFYSAAFQSAIPEDYKPHFKYVGKEPNFLEREKKRGSEAGGSTGMKRTFALTNSLHQSQPTDHNRLFGSSNTLARASLGGKGRLGGISLGMKDSSSQRRPMQMLDIQAVNQIQKETSAAMAAEKSSKSEPTEKDAPVKKKLKTDVAVPKPVKSEDPTKGQSISQESSSVAVAAPKASSDAPATTGMKAPNLQGLFAESPMLTDEEKETIRRFFSSEGSVLFPPGTPEMKFVLQRQEKTNPNGDVVVETIRLKLTCTPQQNWQKSKTTKQLGAKE